MKHVTMLRRLPAVTMLACVAFAFGSCHLGPDLKIYTYPPPVVQDFSPKSGYAGTVVTISGHDFGNYINAATVYFGGAPADSIVSISDSALVVVAPAGGISGKIAVKVWTHQDSTASAFTYLPSPTLAAMTPLQGKAGDELTLTGSHFGTDAAAVTVWFQDSLKAKVVSVSDDKIVVTIPAGGVTGEVILQIGAVTLHGPVFNYPFAGLDFEFNKDGDAEGWLPQQNGTYVVSGGRMQVTFDQSQFGSGDRRADLKLEGGVTLEAGRYPVIAIKMHKPQICNVIFDTNLGQFGNGKNKWTGVLNGDVYYFDLSTTPFGSGNYVSTTGATQLTTFQFKIADVASNENGYMVDWIRSFSSVRALKDSVALAPGHLVYEFNDPGDNEGWIPQQGGSWTAAAGTLSVSFSQTSGNKRADLAETIKGSGPTVTVNTGTFPVMAIKVNIPSATSLFLDTDQGSFGNGKNKYSTDFTGEDVYYWDMSALTLGTKGIQTNKQIDFSTFQFKIADIPESDPATGYNVQWIRSFASKAALAEFIHSEDSLMHK